MRFVAAHPRAVVLEEPRVQQALKARLVRKVQQALKARLVRKVQQALKALKALKARRALKVQEARLVTTGHFMTSQPRPPLCQTPNI
jgi:hypothetical protein